VTGLVSPTPSTQQYRKRATRLALYLIREAIGLNAENSADYIQL